MNGSLFIPFAGCAMTDKKVIIITEDIGRKLLLKLLHVICDLPPIQEADFCEFHPILFTICQLKSSFCCVDPMTCSTFYSCECCSSAPLLIELMIRYWEVFFVCFGCFLAVGELNDEKIFFLYSKDFQKL